MMNHKGYWLLGLLLVFIVAAFLYIERLQQTSGESSPQPYSIVTTYKENPQTSRAFTWYTDNPDAATMIQLVEGTDNTSFEGQDILTFTEATTVIDIGKGVYQGVHKVNATGLQPGTTYRYRVGNGEPSGWSSPSEFTTEAEHTTDFTFINVTDSQGITEKDFTVWGATLSKAFETFPEASFIVHNGDLTEDPEDEFAWNHFFGKAEQWLTRYPLMPVTGNHDEINGIADRFISHFNLPDNTVDGSVPGTSYSFDYGTVHFVVLNTESNKKKQADWLKDDLASTKQPWLIVALHQGPYGGNQDKAVLKQWVPIFDDFGVDLVLQGHNHEYSRSFPLKDGKKTAPGNGTVYVVTNASGNKLNEKKEDLFYHEVHFQNGKPMFAGIRINGDTLTYQAYDRDGLKLDEFALQH